MGCASAFFPGTEEQRDTPQTCQTDQTVNQPGKQSHLAAQQERHQVQSEQGDGTPVQSADNGQSQCESVPDQRNPSNSDLEYRVV